MHFGGLGLGLAAGGEATNRFNTYLRALFLHTLTESALHKCVFEHYTTCMSDLVSKLLGPYMIVSQELSPTIVAPSLWQQDNY